MAEEQCIAIVAYEVMGEDTDKFLNAWTKANEHLTAQNGHVSTALHQAASANPHFRFVNISRWESADDFRAATQSADFRQASGLLEAYPVHASVYDVVRS